MTKAARTQNLIATLAALWRSMAADLSGQYRPERHYMRGPGPKWREKHAPALADDGSRVPSVEVPA
jgi:hypothetical protein